MKYLKNTFNYAVSTTNAVIQLTSTSLDFPLHIQYGDEDIKLGTSEIRMNHCNGFNDGIVANLEVNPMHKNTIRLVHLTKASNMIFCLLNHSYPSMHP